MIPGSPNTPKGPGVNRDPWYLRYVQGDLARRALEIDGWEAALHHHLTDQRLDFGHRPDGQRVAREFPDRRRIKSGFDELTGQPSGIRRSPSEPAPEEFAPKLGQTIPELWQQFQRASIPRAVIHVASAFDPLVGDFALAIDALGVNAEHHIYAMASPLCRFRCVHPCVQPERDGRMPEIVRPGRYLRRA
ncbi:hypothetical protein Pth03_39260 [Planotetraspora thailandica]|uniref:Uncharacterized protein n=2 Tax=Planotetraspora thailandica TaxID=487172 RepID=A0A8J3XUL5_9ACTN|nr:hypothetical protein Pth03_39260 [Planotetraspora thailandica]